MMEIPDFDARPKVALIDILNDPEIKHIPWNELTLGEPIGQGASGLVSRGFWAQPNGKAQPIAFKELLGTMKEMPPDMIKEFLVEIKFMSALDHQNVVKFLGISYPDDSRLYLITELMENGNLRDLLDKKQSNLSFKMRIKFAKDAAKGVAYLHSRKLIHRDLKPQNFLVNDRWQCKVADFGISTVRPEVTRTMTCIGTPIYMAPEVLTKNKYSEKADVYSFGVVLTELIRGVVPYGEGDVASWNQAQLMYHIVHFNLRPSVEGIPPGLEQLILDCWNDDPRLRPSFSEIVVRLRRLRTPTSTSDESVLGLQSQSASTLNSSREDFSLSGPSDLYSTFSHTSPLLE